MAQYTSYDYLSNKPFDIDGIGLMKCPTLQDVRDVTYIIFTICLSILDMSIEEYVKLYNLSTQYSEFIKSNKDDMNIFDLMVIHNRQLLQWLISLFLLGDIVFDEDSASFLVYDKNDESLIISHVHKNNFDKFCLEAQCIVGIKKEEEKAPKFKNEYARKLYEKMEKGFKKQKTIADKNYMLDNMILKYCTHNKVGINILNVWDLTYYQFITMFNEYRNGRQYDINDMMAANTFSYKKSEDYKPLDYINRFN